MSRFEYPRLSRSEIVSFLAESQIISNISERHFADPSPEFVSDLYTQLLIHLDSFQEEDGMDFDAVAQLENPDFHVESMRRVNLYSKTKEVIASLQCPKEFTLKDLVKPDVDGTEIFVSAILNFCFHRDHKMNLLRPIAEELNFLDEQQKEWDIKKSQLTEDIEKHHEAREKEQPLVNEADAKLRELNQTVSELNNHQLSLRTTYKKLKETGSEMDEKITLVEFSLVQNAQENRNLRSKIVQSPDKLQRSLEEKKLVREEALNAEKLAKQNFQEKNVISEVYAKAFKKMTKHLAQMRKIQDQANSAKLIEKDLKALKAKLSEEAVLDKQLDAKLAELHGREEQLYEQRKMLDKERQIRYEEATRELNNVKQEVESQRKELEVRKKDVETVLAEVNAMTSRINQVKEASAAKHQELLLKLEDIIQEFQQYSCNTWSFQQVEEI